MQIHHHHIWIDRNNLINELFADFPNCHFQSNYCVLNLIINARNVIQNYHGIGNDGGAHTSGKDRENHLPSSYRCKSSSSISSVLFRPITNVFNLFQSTAFLLFFIILYNVHIYFLLEFRVVVFFFRFSMSILCMFSPR